MKKIVNLFYILRIMTKIILNEFFGCSLHYCRYCGGRVRDFRVENEIWNAVKPYIKYRDILCYNCFVDLFNRAIYPLKTSWDLIPVSKEVAYILKRRLETTKKFGSRSEERLLKIIKVLEDGCE